ncbi:MAG: hypothetical protein ACRDGQ_14835 [Candidatus Limnocylindrales bacterium]
MSEEQHLALPHLYGAPAYSRPPRPVEEIPRPFDPDELPIEAARTDDDVAALSQLAGTSWAPPAVSRSKPNRRLRIGRASRPAAEVSGPPDPAGSSPTGASSLHDQGGLEGRPFRLRGLGRMFGGDQK